MGFRDLFHRLFTTHIIPVSFIENPNGEMKNIMPGYEKYCIWKDEKNKKPEKNKLLQICQLFLSIDFFWKRECTGGT